MRGFAVAALACFVAACSTLAPPPTDNTAVAELKDPQGNVVGRANLSEVSAGVRIMLEVKALRPAGERGVHIHEKGTCEPPKFDSAGGHFNPGGKQHGTLNPQGPHAGDLPNITIAQDGSGRLETLTDRVTIKAGPTSVFDADGSALIIHAGPDDFRTDPTGNSGGRSACGVITKPAAKPKS